MPHPIDQEPQWTPLTRGQYTEYTRPLLGSELLTDQFSQCCDGMAQCCMGFTFETLLSYSKFCSLVENAWAHLRFRCPTIASRLENIHDPQLRSWVYKPALEVQEVRDWIQRSVEILKEPISVEAFITRTNQQKIEDFDGHLTVRCVIFTIPDKENTFAVFLHGSHTILDARPTFQAFRIMCEQMATLTPFEELRWKTEWGNLPDGPVTATGGPRDNWDISGVDLLYKVSNLRFVKPVTRSLKPPQNTEVTRRGFPIRVHTVIDKLHSQDMIKAVKAAGCTMNHLMEAAQALVICKMNPVPDEEKDGAHVTFPFTIFSLGRWLTEEQKSKDRIITALFAVPVRIDYTDIAAPVSTRDKLLTIMRSLKAQYDSFMENPHLPHLSAIEMKLYPPRSMEMDLVTNPFATTITNLGIIEQFTPSQWYPENDSTKDPMFKLTGMSFGHRITEANPATHTWTMDSQIFIQVQAPDIWDRDYLKTYVEEIRRQAMAILV